jgi:hypothetical protein
MEIFIAQLLPLIFFYTFLAFPDETFELSLQPLGRFIAVSVIIFYSLIDIKYGIAVSILTIFYYQMEFLEKCCEMNSSMLTGSVYTEAFELLRLEPTEFSRLNSASSPAPGRAKHQLSQTMLQTPSANVNNFREEHCKNGRLEFKNKHVKNENAPHIFPGLEFVENTCNPCDAKCGVTIETRLNAEEDLVYPKMSDTWVYKIWNTWFSEDNRRPYAHDTLNFDPASIF